MLTTSIAEDEKKTAEEAVANGRCAFVPKDIENDLRGDSQAKQSNLTGRTATSDRKSYRSFQDKTRLWFWCIK